MKKKTPKLTKKELEEINCIISDCDGRSDHNDSIRSSKWTRLM